MFWNIGDIKNIFNGSHSHLPKLKTFSQKISCKKKLEKNITIVEKTRKNGKCNNFTIATGIIKKILGNNYELYLNLITPGS